MDVQLLETIKQASLPHAQSMLITKTGKSASCLKHANHHLIQTTDPHKLKKNMMMLA
jgi:hypothetical protein